MSDVALWKILFLLGVGFIAGMGHQARGQTITDGDTLRMDGKIYRLHGIDAPELKQECNGWPAGRIAATRLLERGAGGMLTP